MLNENQTKAIEILTKRIPKTINWAFIGSINLAIHGVEVTPRDIDILTDKTGVYEIEEALKEYVTKTTEFKEYKTYSSYRVVFEIEGIEVEALGDVDNKVPNADLWTERSRLSGRTLVNFNKLKVPVINLKQELSAYEKRGRADKVKIIKEFLERLN
jgi:hypothetical protein